MACPRLLGNSCGISNGKYLFAIVRAEPRHCSYTKRWHSLKKNVENKTYKEFTNIISEIENYANDSNLSELQIVELYSKGFKK